MRRKIVAGNWKMNKNVIDAQQLMMQLLSYKNNNAANCEVWIAPPSLYLMMAKDIFEKEEICRRRQSETLLILTTHSNLEPHP